MQQSPQQKNPIESRQGISRRSRFTLLIIFGFVLLVMSAQRLAAELAITPSVTLPVLGMVLLSFCASVCALWQARRVFYKQAELAPLNGGMAVMAMGSLLYSVVI
jgi:hypothetical protein